MKSKHNNPLHFNKHRWTSDDIQSDITPCYTNEIPFVVISKKVKDRNKNAIYNFMQIFGCEIKELDQIG